MTCYDESSSTASPRVVPSDDWIITRPLGNDDVYQINVLIRRRPVEHDPSCLVSGHLHLLINGEAVPLSDENRVWDTRFTFPDQEHMFGFNRSNVTIDADKLPRTDTADFVLVPDPWYVVEHRAEREYWNDEIILKDVPLDWSRVPEPSAEGEGDPE